MAFVRACIARLERGEPGADVMRDMRAHYTTPLSLRSKTCLVRSGYAGALDEAGARAAKGLDAACTTEAERAAVRELVRTRGRARWISHSNAPLDALVERDRHLLLPRHVRDVHITRDEARRCDELKRTHLVARHEHAHRVDGSAWLAEAQRTASRADRAGLFDLALALLLLTGRRTSELLNGRSRFERVPGAPRALRFWGQLKRSSAANDDGDSGATDSYVVPVLADAALVLSALEALRLKQPSNVARLDNAAVSARYQSGLGRHLARHAVYGSVGTSRVHLLRSAYAALVHACFDCGGRTVQAVAHRVCGHTDLADALHYTALALTIDPVDVDALGPLPTDETVVSIVV